MSQCDRGHHSYGSVRLCQLHHTKSHEAYTRAEEAADGISIEAIEYYRECHNDRRLSTVITIYRCVLVFMNNRGSHRNITGLALEIQ